MQITSGWGRLTDKVFRIAGVTADTFQLEGSDTTDTTVYPAGGGGGIAAKITGWTQLTQVLETSTSGGEQQYATYQFLESDREVRIPTMKSASGVDIQIADDPALAGYQLASVANDDRVARPVKITNSNGSITLYLSYISLNKIPSMTVNQVSAAAVSFSLLNEPVRYAS